MSVERFLDYAKEFRTSDCKMARFQAFEAMTGLIRDMDVPEKVYYLAMFRGPYVGIPPSESVGEFLDFVKASRDVMTPELARDLEVRFNLQGPEIPYVRSLQGRV